jgi:hypothetical protein
MFCMDMQVITALMVICNEPLCVEWRHQALQGLQFPDHPNHVAQIWVALTPLLAPSLTERLTAVDGVDLSVDMADRLKAAKQIIAGVRLHPFHSSCQPSVPFHSPSTMLHMALETHQDGR